MLGTARDLAMFMLYLVLAFLILRNAGQFSTALDSIGNNWRQTLTVLQGR